MPRKRAALAIEIPPEFSGALLPSRYKVWYGGRGGAKSWTVARILLAKAYQGRLRILCTREYQNSIADSVHRLLKDQIELLGWSRYFKVTQSAITSRTGSEFLFKGVHHNIYEIKSLEGIDLCWVEEAQRVGKESWSVLIPTIRKEGSEIWVTFNPDLVSDETYQRFVIQTPPDTQLWPMNWDSNPWFSETLRAEKDYCQRVDVDAYRNIWMGEPRKLSNALVFLNKYRVDTFETPANVQFFYGADWGFSQDPTVLTRCFIQDRTLFVDYEAWGIGVEIDATPALFDRVPQSRRWKIYADCARPETISAVRRAGFDIVAARKWAGSVEDGIAYLRQFEAIVIHERCLHALEEFSRYAYKTDRVSGEILPILAPGFDHVIDAIRYSLAEYIHSGQSVYAYSPVASRGAIHRERAAPAAAHPVSRESLSSRHGAFNQRGDF